MKPQQHILFLTTNNLATNPRLYKEVQTALGLGYRTTVATYRLGNWSDAKSKVLGAELENLGVREIEMDATNKSKYKWLKWGLLEQIARFVYPLFRNNQLVNALASSRRSLQILGACKNSEKPDLIVAHNLGAAYPAFRLSQKWQIPFIFDVEDYHPGESIKKYAKNEKARREYLMKSLLPKAAALTSASPLIEEYSLKLIGGHPNHRVILNCFPANEFILPNSTIASYIEPIKFVWFSQKISFGRGLKQLFEALVQISTSNTFRKNPSPLLSLTLIGELDNVFYQKKIEPFKKLIEGKHKSTIGLHNQSVNESAQNQLSIQLIILPPLPQRELHQQLRNFDIGLALEPGKDLNNNLAISNKIIAYSQAGLYILATNTPAQNQFISDNPKKGLVCCQNEKSIAETIVELMNKSKEIKKDRVQRYEIGQSLTWEKESLKLSSIWATL